MKLVAHTPDADLRYVLMRFPDGLVIDPRTCPRGILTRSHWSSLPDSPKAVCSCGDAK